MTICELLGVPHDDRPRFEHPTTVLFAGTRTSVEEKQGAQREFYDYVRGVIAEKRAHPGDDLLSELLAANELSDDELAGVAWFLFAAGHETTAGTLTTSLFFLLYDRERWELVRSHPSSIERAVEELMRYLPANRIGLASRMAREDIEVAGVTIKAGESVTVHVDAPNRDPERFPDPDRFDPSRDATGHLLFGFGRHMCLGMHLARLELQVSIRGLMERFPTLRLAVPQDEVPIRVSGFGYGAVERLPVTW
jgi:cytochrome P450